MERGSLARDRRRSASVQTHCAPSHKVSTFLNVGGPFFLPRAPFRSLGGSNTFALLVLSAPAARMHRAGAHARAHAAHTGARGPRRQLVPFAGPVGAPRRRRHQARRPAIPCPPPAIAPPGSDALHCCTYTYLAYLPLARPSAP